MYIQGHINEGKGSRGPIPCWGYSASHTLIGLEVREREEYALVEDQQALGKRRPS
jgi:hypothetical protein